MVESSHQWSSPRKKETKRQSFHKFCLGTLGSGYSLLIFTYWVCVHWWDLRSITFHNFDQNIKCSGKYWIGYSKYKATKTRWSYHLVWMRKHTYKVSLKEFLKLFKCLASSGIHTVSGWLDLLLKALHQERKKKKWDNSFKACMGTLSCACSPPIYRLSVWGFFMKTLIIISISTNIYKPYVCDHLGPYISLVNNSIYQITPYWSNLINYLHPNID